MKSTRRRCLGLCVLIATLVLALDMGWEPLYRLELQTLDWRFLRRGPRAADPSVVLIAIDEKSLVEMSPVSAWPWPRSVHAELIDFLKRTGAAVIVVDLLFAERQTKEQDRALAVAVRRAGNVFLAAHLPHEPLGRGGSAAQETVELTPDRLTASEAMRHKTLPAPAVPPDWMLPPSRELFWTLPLPELVEAAGGVGMVDQPADPDAVYRRALLLRAVDSGRLYPHLALAAAARALGVGPEEIRVTERAVLLGRQRTIPVPPSGGVLIDFVGPPPSAHRPSLFPRYSYSEVWRLARSERATKQERKGATGRRETLVGRIPPEAFRGKVVLVGATAPGLLDTRPSPYSPVNTGVETNANLVNAILQRRFFTEPGPWLAIALELGIGLLAGLGLAVLPMRSGALFVLLFGSAYTGLSLWLFSAQRVVLPIAGPLLALAGCYVGATAYRFQTEYRERRRLRAYLDLYVTPQVAERILNDPKTVLAGRRVEVSVLFADIRGFTTMSEAMRPEEVVAMLNEYFEQLVPLVMAQEGTLMQYVGDEIMAVWGAPTNQPDHAARAVRTAVAMLEALGELHATWRKQNLPTFDIGIGIHSGPAVVANVGARKRPQYSIIGDTVNTASRLEGLNKELGTRVLISNATYALTRELIDARPLEPVRVKGKSEPLQVYEVRGLKAPDSQPHGAR